ncbi:unnamed protein product [Cylindrotheca closterium]|uniref:Uncharacterized protein n=1 Tax=Cylindrotheca closterium TaxID=2856 RepID=A0AAD2CPL4_9STRA|nr:unnamed protein product [Cylindrotheca closterium]
MSLVKGTMSPFGLKVNNGIRLKVDRCKISNKRLNKTRVRGMFLVKGTMFAFRLKVTRDKRLSKTRVLSVFLIRGETFGMMTIPLPSIGQRWIENRI